MTRAAILWGLGEQWSVEDVELAGLGPREVRVKLHATGLCHSEDHAVTGDMPFPLPVVGGHEGAGVVEAVGAAVTRVVPGDHVVLVLQPPCGHCRNCARGRQHLCLNAAGMDVGKFQPFSARGQSIPGTGDLGTFAEATVVTENNLVKIDEDIPLDVAALLGCAVPVGWGAAVYLAEVRPGDNVVVIGCGGVGVNSLQGAKIAGANVIVAVDTVELKRQKALEFGATHAVASLAEASALLADLTDGRMADSAIMSIGVGDGRMVGELIDLTGQGGITVITSVASFAASTVEMNLGLFTLNEKTLRGNVYGGCQVHRDIPLLLDLYRQGKLKLDELITQRYTLDEVNEGYADMHAGKNLRGVIMLDG